ncbi:MAG: carboxypeptidase-like regulatory domain-containing protein [Acidobacteriota bacterium]
MRMLKGLLLVLACLVILPAAAFAQASITGVVKDGSGAVLPGVTVEASSDALIEKVRSAVTDGSGQYRIVDLRAGTYTVTFSLTGFSSIKREGVELTGSFTATINADMKIGTLQETITVTGETPIVDTQSVRRQTTVSNEVISSMPAARSYAGVMLLIPATTTQAGANLDIQVTPGMLVFGGAGGRTNEARIQVDGLNTGAAFNGAGVSSYVVDIGNAAEISMTTSGGLGEAEVGGPSFSIVPKTGGNTIKGSAYASNVTSGMVGNNYTRDLQDKGLTTPGKLYKLWDYNVGVGGPIKKDRIWFFFQFRDEGSHRTIPGMFANANMGDATKWTYVKDTTRPAVAAGSWRNASLRLTLQPTTRNKFNVFWDQQMPCQGAGYLGSNDGCRQSGPGEIICGAAGASNPPCSATTAPEIGTYLAGFGQRVQQATWTSPLTNKLLLEAGFGTYWSQWGGVNHPGSNFTQLVGVTEQCTNADCASFGGIPGLQYRSGTYRQNLQGTVTWRGSASYVTGAQNMKVGYQGGYLYDNQFTYTNDQFAAYRFNSGIPNQITENINAFPAQQRVRYDSLYAQDQVTRGRFTVQGALRYDRAWSFFPEVTVGPVRFLPTAVTYPFTEGVNSYKDLTPRGGLAIDVFGNGKTSVKVNVGRYLQAAQNGLAYGALRPSSRLQTTTTRTWSDLNGNYIPDCDLRNPGAQSPATTGSVDNCTAVANSGFGTNAFTSDLDQTLRNGWGVRPGDWGFGASVQQEILPRVSVEVGYNRRWLNNFTWDDNVLQATSDYKSFTVVAPQDSRLEGFANQTSGLLYNVNPNVQAATNNVTKLASDAGGNYTQVYNGILLNISARPRSGLVFQGGFNTGATRTDYCDVRTASPEYTVVGAQSPNNPWCNTSTGLVTRYTGLGSYTIPKIDVLFSGTFRSDQGAPLAANWTITNTNAQWTSITQQLGRAPANNATSLVVNIVEPGKLYGDRVNEFDLRFAKILRFGRTRTNIGFDLYNILNSAAILSYNQNFSPAITTGSGAWLAPTGVLQPRFWKFSIQTDF